MTRRIRHSPADCDVGDFFPVQIDHGSNLVWYFMPYILPPKHPPRWTFHRAAWRSDSGPYVLDVYVRKA